MTSASAGRGRRHPLCGAASGPHRESVRVARGTGRRRSPRGRPHHARRAGAGESARGRLPCRVPPVYAVLGNHDYHAGREDEVGAVLEAAGIGVLHRDAVVCEVAGVDLGIVGTKGFVGGFRRGDPGLRRIAPTQCLRDDARGRGARGRARDHRGLSPPCRPAALRAGAETLVGEPERSGPSSVEPACGPDRGAPPRSRPPRTRASRELRAGRSATSRFATSPFTSRARSSPSTSDHQVSVVSRRSASIAASYAAM